MLQFAEICGFPWSLTTACQSCEVLTLTWSLQHLGSFGILFTKFTKRTFVPDVMSPRQTWDITFTITWGLSATSGVLDSVCLNVSVLLIAGMRVLHWSMLGVTILLLMCEIAISQLCKSLITLVDGFHTLFILMHLALPLPQTASTIKTSLSTLEPSTSPHASSIEPPAGTQTVTAQPNHETPSVVNPHQPFSPKISPVALNCGLSYHNSRVQVVRVFISTLLLVSLCISYFMEIIHFFLKPHPVHQPQLLVVVGVVSTLYKMLVFRLSCDRLRHKKTGVVRQEEETGSHLLVNQKGNTEKIMKEGKGLFYLPAHNSLAYCTIRDGKHWSNPADLQLQTTDLRPVFLVSLVFSYILFLYILHSHTY